MTFVSRLGQRHLPSFLLLCLLPLAACDLFSRAPLGADDAAQSGGVQLVFRTEPGGLFRFHRLTTGGNRIYAATEDNLLLALDMATGGVAWRVDGGNEELLGEATYGDGRVFTAAKFARGWDAATGAPLWQTDLQSNAFRHIGHAADGMFYIGTDTSVFALEGATGAIRWRTSVGADWAYDGRVRSIAGDGELLYVCAGEPLASNAFQIRGHIVALDAATGAIRWRHVMAYETNYNFCMGEPTVAGDLVVVGDAGGNNFVAVDRATGEFRWRSAGDPEWVGPYASPEAFGDTLYAASNDKRIVALDRATGRTLWTTETDGSAWYATRCGRVVLASDMSMWVLDPQTGKILGSHVQIAYSRDDLITSRFLVRNNYAYAVGNGRFYKWRCPT